MKAKIAKINAEDKKSTEQIGLIFNDNQLDNDKTVGESKVENDNIVYLVYKKDGTEGGKITSNTYLSTFFSPFAGSNDWEAVDVQKPKTEEEKKD